MQAKLGKIEKRYEELENLLADHKLIADTERYGKLVKELSDLKEPVMLYREYKRLDKELAGLESMISEKHDSELLEMARKELAQIKEQKSSLETKLKKALAGEDKDAGKSVIVEIRQGTGGAEAALFAADLYRMYAKYADAKSWTVELMSGHATDEGGFKEVVFSVKGRDAFRCLKFESGVHRVQRVPQTEAQGRIHTSTATVVVLVEPENVDLAINPSDLKIETYRSSGPGGQHMQKTDSAVRITHIPTGVVVACQDERSQIKNKSKAMRILGSKLLDMKQQEEAKKITDARRAQVGTGDRNEKIRTYNFPDRRVTDHRINFTSFQLESIMEGELGEFSEALIKAAQDAAENNG
ncbi:MAG: peptide chain release factor 1 [Candidatus Omnitrophica bacterium]|nr:peptide chain release factor 1 [Candidatus Omnitrophota bacterium]